jgi:4-alpha-glucanotransferase
MSDGAIYDLAKRAGIAVDWRDFAGRPHRVAVDSLRQILTAMDLPCATPNDLVESIQNLELNAMPPLITATINQPVHVPLNVAGQKAQIRFESGNVADLEVKAAAHGIMVPPLVEIGYHQLEIGSTRIAIAVAPARCTTITDITAGQRIWGLAAQIYGLRSPDDCGVGDMAGAVALGRAAANINADVLALSPLHALFAADPSRFSPYSPSTRMFYNPLHADATSIFGEAWAAVARGEEIEEDKGEGGAGELIDWPRASRQKMAMFRRLFERFVEDDLSTDVGTRLAEDFSQFRAECGAPLAEHALFEALHAARLSADRDWNWQDWPAQWRDPHSSAVREFASENEREILFHSFLQWIADRSLAAGQQKITKAGMRIGLLADFAVGTNPAGSSVWSKQKDVLVGLQIGAPPDLFNTDGQNWGLTTFSPRALAINGFAPFIASLRACLRHAGGVRIDHVMGLMRLWVVPCGAKASEGAYLSYPLEDLLRLIALESHHRKAIVIGEDLGTVPIGFRERLAAAGIYGMSVLWFERKQRDFVPPRSWPTNVAAMTSTHDLPTVVGWWLGQDLAVRNESGFISDLAAERNARSKDRRALWRAFRAAKVASGETPAPEESTAVGDAAINFLARTRSQLALLPLEDALALPDQPNLPGTVDQQPNWRRRYSGDAATMLDDPRIQARLRPLTERQGR